MHLRQISAAKKRQIILNKPTFFQVFPWLWLAAAYCGTILFFYYFGRPYIDSDMASEMILADMLNQQGGILAENWWYSTELRVFYLQPFFRVGLLLFPENWHAARMCGQALVLMLLLISYFYAVHNAKLRNWGVWGAAALACPFGFWICFYGNFGGFYYPHMILVLVSFGAIQHLTDPGKQQKKIIHIIHFSLLAASSLLSGMNSVKGIMALYLPMAAASTVLFFMQWHVHPETFPKGQLRQFIWSMLALAIAGVGYLINSQVFALQYVFSDYNSQNWRMFEFSTLIDKWSGFLSLFGYPAYAEQLGLIPVFSIVSILGSIGFLTAGAIVVSLIRLLMRWQKLNPKQRVFPVLFASILLIQGLIFACIGYEDYTYPFYWLTALPFVFPVIQLEGETESFQFPHARKLAALAFCACILATSASSVLELFTVGHRANPQLEVICDELMNRGYTQGYSTFWNGNVLTEWSSGKIEMWVTTDFNTMAPYTWLQKTSHADPPEGEIFLLAKPSELDKMGLSHLPEVSNVVYTSFEWVQWPGDGEYLVMLYPSYDDMMASVEQAQQLEPSDPDAFVVSPS